MDRFRFGRAVRALRQRRGWRQVDLAARSGLSQSLVSRIELGQIGASSFDDLSAIAAALDGQLALDFRWRGEQLDRLIDEEHASIIDQLVGIYRDSRWDVGVEVTFSIFGERGSIDVFAAHPIAHVVAVNEIKASIGDAGNTVIGVDRKTRLAPKIAAERGWDTRRGVAQFLVLRDTTTSRARVARHADIFRTAFPADGRASLDWIRNPTGPPPSGIIFLPDTRPTGDTRRRSAARRVRAAGARTDQE